MKLLRVGVLGGIGPQATGQFYLKCVKRLQQEGLVRKNEDFPQFLINSIPAPELVFNSVNKKELEPYIKGLQEIDHMDVDFIVMVCNTIHIYYDELQARIRTPILDLRQEVHQAIKRSGKKKATILGTPSTMRTGLYAFEGIEYVNPKKEELDPLSEAIFAYNRGERQEKHSKTVSLIAKRLLAEGSEVIVLACTEFALMLENESLPMINTMDVLVNAVIRRCKEKRR